MKTLTQPAIPASFSPELIEHIGLNSSLWMIKEATVIEELSHTIGDVTLTDLARQLLQEAYQRMLDQIEAGSPLACCYGKPEELKTCKQGSK